MAWSSGASAEIYKWVDQKGVTNYSSTPPAKARAQTLDQEAATVSVYQTTAPQDLTRLNDLMQQKVAMLENQLRAERQTYQTQQASYQTDPGLAYYEQCLKERRVDCDTDRFGRAATPYSPYFYAAAAPWFVRPGPLPVTRTMVSGIRVAQPVVLPARTHTHGGPRGLARKF